jgi:hypothetical protein
MILSEEKNMVLHNIPDHNPKRKRRTHQAFRLQKEFIDMSLEQDIDLKVNPQFTSLPLYSQVINPAIAQNLEYIYSNNLSKNPSQALQAAFDHSLRGSQDILSDSLSRLDLNLLTIDREIISLKNLIEGMPETNENICKLFLAKGFIKLLKQVQALRVYRQ